MPTDGAAVSAGRAPEFTLGGGWSAVALWRRSVAWVGVLALAALAGFGTLGGAGIFAAAAFAALTAATILAWIELGGYRRRRLPDPGAVAEASSKRTSGGKVPRGRTRAGLLAVGITAAVAIGAVQTWFTPGTAIAGGDLAPPNGTAWLGRLFAPWTWSGSDLGHPGSLEPQLPWACLLWLVHRAGGSAALAQRLWFTFLFLGAALGALWLLRLLRASWAASTVGSLLYLFNPFVVSNIGTNPVFLAALVLIVVEPAIVISVTSGRWRRRTGAVALVATVPLVGYAYENPPLVLAVVLAAGVALVGSFVWAGRSACRRALGFLALGIPLAIAVSLYWALPALEQLKFEAVHQLSTLSSWTWTETRSTLANAFWLNTSWAWPYKYYVPYSGAYAALPLSMLRYAFPFIGFSALTVRFDPSLPSQRRSAVAAAGATGSLLFVFLSTGTRLPGSLLFDPLYHLPYGWLLQGPGRFLLLAGLGYAVMAVVTVDTWMDYLDRALGAVGGWAPRRTGLARAVVAVGIVGVAAIAPGFPLAFGAVAPGRRPDSLPSTHVRVPQYWTQIANYLNGPASPAGNLLVFPPDPFYQMLYTWGYYGNDGFITDMIGRNVLDPAGQGYGAASGALIGDVNQAATTLLAGDDTAANRILSALGTPLILVREDLSVQDPVVRPDSPKRLAAALAADPRVRLVRRFGPLLLYRLREDADIVPLVRSGVPYATSRAPTPNLVALSALPPGTAIVRHAPIPGVPDVVQVPSESAWQLDGRNLRAVVPLPPGRSYRLLQLGTAKLSQLDVPLRIGALARVGPALARVGVTRRDAFASVSTRVGPNELSDGNFETGQWQTSIGNCDAVPGTSPQLSGRLGLAPPGLPGAELMLSASGDIACEARAISWRGGPVLLSLSARDLSGPAPAICLWEVGPDRCATLPPFASSRSWQRYQQVVSPSGGTRGLSLFLYALGGPGGTRGASAFADVEVRSLAVSPPLAILATGNNRSVRPPSLTTMDSTFSSVWTSPRPAQHVLVNGVANGWLSSATGLLTPRNTTDPILALGETFAIVGAAGALLVGASVGLGSLAVSMPRRRRVRPSGDYARWSAPHAGLPRWPQRQLRRSGSRDTGPNTASPRGGQEKGVSSE